ncbi:hypothetical protein ACQJBY_033226 [Aegilops geniculata]
MLYSFHPPGNGSSSMPASTSCMIHIGSSWFEPYKPVDRPSGAESEALDRETPLRVCLDSDAPPEIEYYDLSHEFDMKMLHPVRDDDLQVFSARFNKVFGKCQSLGNVCFLHGISTRNGRLCVAMRFSEGSIGDRMAQLKGGRLPLSDVLRRISRMANMPESPEYGGSCNMKKTIRTKGGYTNSQERKETCSDGELPECCFPPHEVLRILKGVNKSRRRLTSSLGTISRLAS